MKQGNPLMGTKQPANGRYKARCSGCYQQLETEPSDRGVLVVEVRFNGKFSQPTGNFGFRSRSILDATIYREHHQVVIKLHSVLSKSSAATWSSLLM